MPPTNPDSNATLKTEPIADGCAEKMTFGLPPEWQIHFEWAQNNQVVHELQLVIDALLLHKKPASFKYLLEDLGEPIAREILEKWSEHLPEARILRNLTLANESHPEFSLYGPAHKSVPADRLFRGELETHYLISLIAEQIPSHKDGDYRWFLILRLWLLIHALRRARLGNLQDTNLREIATRLRQASKTEGSWRSFFQFLHTDFSDFLTVNSHLLALCSSTAPVRGFSLAIESLEALKSAIRSVAKMEDAAEDIPGSNFSPCWDNRQAKLLWTDVAERTDIHWGIPEEPSDDEAFSTRWLAETEGESDLGEIGVDPLESYQRQELSVRQYFAANVEELHFLPWMWDRLNPHEEAALNNRIDVSLESSDLKQQLLAVFVWIALVTGRSLTVALHFSISEKSKEEWSLNLEKKRLHRIPPKRQSAWTPSVEQRLYVLPVAECISIQIREPLIDILNEAITDQSNVKTFGDLWDYHWQEDQPESLFTRQMQGQLSRITPGKLKNSLPMRLFRKSGDPSLTRMLSVRPNVSLPGACAYTSWTLDKVEQILSQDHSNLVSLHDPMIGAGSRLYPVTEWLNDAIERATSHLAIATDGTDIVTFHNTFTAYITLCLWAGTGMRPIQDSLESVNQLDLDLGVMYINDKHSNAIHEGRLTPLPLALIRFFSETYPKYLRILFQTLKPHHPYLAEEIVHMASGYPSTKMPYMFFGSSPD